MHFHQSIISEISRPCSLSVPTQLHPEARGRCLGKGADVINTERNQKQAVWLF